MSDTKSTNRYSIFVNDTEIYEGDFREVPEKFRDSLTEGLDEWGEILGKSNLNEMIYSLLAWYEEKQYLCSDCGEEQYPEADECEYCGAEVYSQYRYDRNEKLTRIILCTGMITHIQIK